MGLVALLTELGEAMEDIEAENKARKAAIEKNKMFRKAHRRR